MVWIHITKVLLLVSLLLCVCNATETKCISGFVFDHRLQSCQSVLYNTPECSADQEEGIFIPHENCNQFYVCFMGSLTVQTCPAGLEFNPSTNQCDWPSPNGCSSSTSTTVTTEPSTSTIPTTTEAARKCDPQSGDMDVLPHPSDCRKFIICYFGVPLVYTCDSHKGFNSKLLKCVLLADSDCAALEG